MVFNCFNAQSCATERRNKWGGQPSGNIKLRHVGYGHLAYDLSGLRRTS